MTTRPTRLPNAARGRVHTDGDDDGRRGTGRTTRGRQSRRLLVDAARTVFEQRGFLHTRVADICAAADMAHGSFYTYFRSKEDVLREIIEAVEVDLHAADPAPEGTDPVERIRLANRHFVETYRENARIIAVIEQVATFDDDARAARLARQEAFAAAIERRIRTLQRAGVATDAVDARYAAYALGGMVTAFTEHMVLGAPDGAFDPEVAVEQLTLLWVRALGIPSGGRTPA